MSEKITRVICDITGNSSEKNTSVRFSYKDYLELCSVNVSWYVHQTLGLIQFRHKRRRSLELWIQSWMIGPCEAIPMLNRLELGVPHFYDDKESLVSEGEGVREIRWTAR